MVRLVMKYILWGISLGCTSFVIMCLSFYLGGGDEVLAEKLYNNGDWITLEAYFGITSKYEK